MLERPLRASDRGPLPTLCFSDGDGGHVDHIGHRCIPLENVDRLGQSAEDGADDVGVAETVEKLVQALTAVRLGKPRTFAARVKGPSGRLDLIRFGTVVVSACIWPSTRMSGRAGRNSSTACRTRAG